MSQQSTGGWSDTLRDVFSNGLNASIDRYLGPETAYQPTAMVPLGGGQGTQDAQFEPYDDTPGEALQPRNRMMDNQTLIIGGVGLVLALGLIVLVVRR